ncbi:uncharacterized protein STEHIDRAFT_102585 [Stereum hirsutum FP-91666 SS1]|uniref:uncharacterized protein n=1 Tax=Stereum hirsutum (strain FP-91666) TaxID=721885 RepID=UPI00044497CC|nr:uncharacterized protein STEHIDRAFT_102585 [Stereum hirsutum FP-91666 SS1]EIM83050.1 hypothetical protein STEHIDRAFT_102585 [Stereum hirsutum FP-91666 SS1]
MANYAKHKAIVSSAYEKFEKAKAEGDLLFFPSEVSTHQDSGVEFQIRLCPALLHKPPLPTPHFDPASESDAHTGKGKPDPFMPPYVPNLYIGELKDEEEGDEYVFLLNKYSVVPYHFLMVTKDFQSQTSPLMPPDLVNAYSTLVAARKLGKPLFAFYNCGDVSGASQPHKHLQFIPIDDEDGPPIEQLARSARLETPDKPFSLPTLPFANHIHRLTLPLTPSPSLLAPTLAQSYLSLLDLIISTVRHDPTYPPGTPSYNILLTLQHIYAFPRRHEFHVLEKSGERLSVNALGYAGMLLVKDEGELEAVRGEGIGRVLRSVGCESIHEEQVRGSTEMDEI